MKRNYLVVYEKGRKNFSGFVPDLPGCASAGETLEEMRCNMREALEGYLQVSIDFGDDIPLPSSETITLPIQGELDPKTTYVVEFISIAVPRKTSSHKPKALRRELAAA